MSEKNKKNFPIFGRRLTVLRKGRHLTQPELAEKVGMTREMISYLETRARNPTMEQIRKFAEFFDVSADELIFERRLKRGRRGPKSRLEMQFERLLGLPEAKKKVVGDMLDGLLGKNSEKEAM